MGLVTAGAAIARFLGFGAARATPLAARVGAAAARLAPGAAAGAAGGAAFEAGRRLLTGGAAPAQVRGFPVPDDPFTTAADFAVGGPRFELLDDGSQILVSGTGVVQRANLFLPAGAKFPAGATVVSVSPDGQLFGLRKARRKKPSFQSEIDRCGEAIRAADRLLATLRKKKK